MIRCRARSIGSAGTTGPTVARTDNPTFSAGKDTGQAVFNAGFGGVCQVSRGRG
jgi:hypothetical protein